MLFIKEKKRKKNFYITIIAYITISLILLLTLVSVVFFTSYNRFSLTMLSSYSMDSLFQISYSVDFMMKSADSISNQIYLDYTVRPLMYIKHDNDLESLNGLRHLNDYINSAENIHSIYILNGKDKQVSFSIKRQGKFGNDVGIKDIKEFYDKEFLESIQNGTYSSLNSVVRKIRTENIAAYDRVYSFVLLDSKSSLNTVDGAVIINYSADWLYNTISYLDKSPENTIFIIDKEGYVVSHNKMFSYLTNLSGIEYIDNILDSNDHAGYFTCNINGSKSLITFTSSNNSSWKLIRITPYQSILSRLYKMRFISLIAYIGITLLGIITSMVVSRKLYKPYNSINNKLKSLESKNREISYFAKQKFMQSLLENSSFISYNDLMKKFKALNIDLNFESPYTLILFKIDHYNDFCSKYNQNDRNHFKFGMANIASEICSEYCISECVTSDSDHIVVVTSTTCEEVIDMMVVKCLEQLSSFLETTCSASISSSRDNLSFLNLMYHEALEISKYRMFKGPNSIIHPGDVPVTGSAEFEYPENKEKLLLDSIKLGKIESARNYYDDFINYITNYDYNTFIHAINRLVLSISITAGTLRENSDVPLKMSFDSLLLGMSTLETVEEINEMIHLTLEKISGFMNNIKDVKNDKLVEIVKETIDKGYANFNLTVDFLAENAKMSSSHLRRLFKRSTNISLSDYITEVRMAKARELLKNSSLSVAEISEKIGFVNRSYFFTAFRKAHGVTPNDYRTSIIPI